MEQYATKGGLVTQPNLLEVPETDPPRWTPRPEATRHERMRFWDHYLDSRNGTYEFRCKRYDAVIDRLKAIGCAPSHSITDIGAGRMEFVRRMRERGLHGMYVPEDGVLDGIDFNIWEPRDHTDWCVGIEVIEHVHDPQRLLHGMKIVARAGVVVTTPNPDVVDVASLDPTHVSEVTLRQFQEWGWYTETHDLFGKQDDTILAWWGGRIPIIPRKER